MRVKRFPVKLTLLVFVLMTSAITTSDYAVAESVSVSGVPGKFLTFGTKDGLASDMVLDICEAADGTIWIATLNGLCRFDGAGFHTYCSRNKNGTLSDNRIRCICNGSDNCLWIGTESGLERFDMMTGLSEKVPVVTDSDGNAVDIAVKSVLCDSDSSLWMHLSDGKICHYFPDTGQMVSTVFNSARLEGDYWYDHIFKDRQGRIWVGGRATSVARISGGDICTTFYPVRNPDIEHFEGSAFALGEDGRFYASDDKGNFSEYDAVKDRFKTILKIPGGTTCATTDSAGRIWIGGRTALARLRKDNIGFDLYRNIPGEEQSVASNNIYCLYTDRNGNVWIGTDKGLSVFPAYNNAIQSFNIRNGLSSNAVTALMQDRDSVLWIGTEENGVDTLNLKTFRTGNLRYDLLGGRLSPQIHEREKETLSQYALHGLKSDGSINENRVSALYQDSHGIIYIGLWSHIGFNTFDKKSDIFKRYCLWSVPAGYVFPLLFEGNLFGANWYTGFLEDSRGNLWCTTWEGVGLNLFDRKKGEFTGVHFIPGDVPRMPHGTISTHVDDIENGRIYMAGGRWYGYFDLRSRDFHRYVENFPPGFPNAGIIEGYYRHSPAKQIDIPVNTLDLRVLDKYGDRVLVSSANSLFVHNVRTDEVEVLYKPEKFRIEYDLFRSHDGIYVAWDNEYVKASRNEECGFKVVRAGIPAGVEDFSYGGSFSLGGDSLFVQTDEGSMIRIGNTGMAVNISLEASRTLPSRLASCIAEDNDGYLWYGTTDSGLCRIDVSTGDIRVFRNIADNQGADGKGKTSAGNHREDSPVNSSCIDIRDIFVDSSGEIWVCTENGLWLKDSTDCFALVNALGNISVRRIVEDRSGRLWISSDGGLFCIGRDGARLYEFHERDGLSNETFSGAAAVLADGRLCFGGMDGFDIIDPDTLLDMPCPHVVLSGFRTSEDTLFHSVPDVVNLRYRDNSFSVDFSSPIRTGNPKRFRLDGFDKEWNYSYLPKVTARYTNIPGGKYTLDAEILDGSGVWCRSSVCLVVERPFWLQWWFILSAIVLAVLGIVVFVRIRMRFLKAENDKLARLVDKRTAQLIEEIESKDKFLSIVAHDLRNPMNSLKLLSYSLMMDWNNFPEEDRIRKVGVMNRAASDTADLLDDMLNWALAESGITVANKRNLVLKDAVDDAVRSLGGIFEKKNIRIENQVENDLSVMADKDMLAVILRNLIANAVKYSFEGGLVTVTSGQMDGKAIVSITDQGIGMDSLTIDKLFRIDAKISVRGTGGETGKGFGLVTVREFLDKMGEEIKVESSSGKGSRFSFTLAMPDSRDGRK